VTNVLNFHSKNNVFFHCLRVCNSRTFDHCTFKNNSIKNSTRSIFVKFIFVRFWISMGRERRYATEINPWLFGFLQTTQWTVRRWTEIRSLYDFGRKKLARKTRWLTKNDTTFSWKCSRQFSSRTARFLLINSCFGNWELLYSCACWKATPPGTSNNTSQRPTTPGNTWQHNQTKPPVGAWQHLSWQHLKPPDNTWQHLGRRATKKYHGAFFEK
jgi:hypothetical protein